MHFEQSTLPFGTALDAETSGTTNQRFTSYDRSTVAQLDYAVNRSYSAGQGRFTSVDPIGMQASFLSDPQTLNLYSYCGNDPINHTDPDGLFFGKLFKAIGNFFKKAAKLIAVVVAVALVVAAVVYSGGTVAGFATSLGKLLAGFIPSAGIEGTIAWGFSGWALGVNAAVAVGAISQFAQTKDDKKGKKPKSDKILEQAISNVRSILSKDNPCSKFFGPHALKALDAFEKAARKGYIDNPTTGIRMTVPLGNPAKGQVFRSPSDVVINQTGGFYLKVAKTPRFGGSDGYSNGGNRTQILQILHEVAHLTKDPNGSGWLILDDGKSQTQSDKNTEKIQTACRNEIESIKD